MSLHLETGRFFGSSTAAHTPAGLIVSETVYAGGATLPRHSHEAPYLCLVVRGGYEESCEGRAEACGQGALLFHPADSVHADRFGPAGATCFNVQFGPEWDERLRESRLAGAPWQPLRTGAAALARRVRSELRSPDALSPLAIESMVLALLVDAGRNERRRGRTREPAWVRRARERLSAQVRLPPSLADLAADAGVSASYFARAFRAHTGLTPSGYVRSLRVQRARELLRGPLPLSIIAHELGYADQAHFTRQFRDAEGMAPGEFRRAQGLQAR